jgi:hypothetical protein
MLNFWENISRYPRFFASSVFGLILILIRPFRNLLRTKSGIVVLLIGSIVIILFISITLLNMLNL